MTLPPVLPGLWPDAWSAECEWLAAALLANAWQSAAIALFLAMLLPLVPRLPARQHCRLWSGGIAAGIMLPLLSLITFEMHRHGSASAQIAATAIGGTPFHIAPVWSTAIVLTWVLACLCASIRFAAGISAVARLLRDAHPVPAELASSFPDARLLMSPHIAAPVTTGFMRPVILLPTHLPQTLSSRQLEQVLLHELAHAQRRDHQINLLVRLLCCMLPLSPALAYMDRRLAAARELACDDAVLACSPAPKAYAACLLRVAECAQIHSGTHKGHMMASGLLGRRSQLAGRIAHILTPTQKGRHTHSSALLTLAAGGALAVLTIQLDAMPALVSFAPIQTPPMLAVQAVVPPSSVLPAEPVQMQPVRLARHRRVRASTVQHMAVAAPFSIPSVPLGPAVVSVHGQGRAPVSAQLVVFWQQPVQSSPGTFVLLVSGRSRWLLYRTMPGGFLLPI